MGKKNAKELTYKKIVFQPKVEASSAAQLLQGRASTQGSTDLRLLPPLSLANISSSQVGHFPLKTDAWKSSLERLLLSAFLSAQDKTTQRFAGEILHPLLGLSSDTGPGCTVKLTTGPGEDSEND